MLGLQNRDWRTRLPLLRNRCHATTARAAMPKVLSYTPAWLSRPSDGFGIFAKDHDAANGHASKAKASTCLRRLAARGTEVFYAVGTEIRWANLQSLKNGFKRPGTANGSASKHEEAYKVSRDE
jgi:hypothetical protein